MANPVDPGTLTSLTPQLPATAPDADISANRVTFFDETVRMVNQLNVVLPNAQTNAIAAKEGADDAVAAKNAAELAKTGAESARDSAETAADRAEQAAADVERPVSRDAKATAVDISLGTPDKWVDAAGAKAALDAKQDAGDYADAQSVADIEQRLNSTPTLAGEETLSGKTLNNAKETQRNLGTGNSISPATASNAAIRPTGTISFAVGTQASADDIGKSSIVAITPSAAVTFAANTAVKWPGSGTPPVLASGRTYLLSLVNMQIGSQYFWLANIAGPY